MDVEDCLRDLAHKAALARHLAPPAALSDNRRTPPLSRVEDVAGEVEGLAREVRAALQADARHRSQSTPVKFACEGVLLAV